MVTKKSVASSNNISNLNLLKEVSTPESDKEELSNPHQYNYLDFKTGFSDKSYKKEQKEHEIISQKEKVEFHFTLKTNIQRSSSQPYLMNPIGPIKDKKQQPPHEEFTSAIDLGNSNNADYQRKNALSTKDASLTFGK